MYTSSVNRVNYYVGGEIITIAHMDRYDAFINVELVFIYEVWQQHKTNLSLCYAIRFNPWPLHAVFSNLLCGSESTLISSSRPPSPYYSFLSSGFEIPWNILTESSFSAVGPCICSATSPRTTVSTLETRNSTWSATPCCCLCWNTKLLSWGGTSAQPTRFYPQYPGSREPGLPTFWRNKYVCAPTFAVGNQWQTTTYVYAQIS